MIKILIKIITVLFFLSVYGQFSSFPLAYKHVYNDSLVELSLAGSNHITRDRTGLKSWRTGDGLLQCKMNFGKNGIAALSPDGKKILTHNHGKIRIYDTSTQSLLKQWLLKGHQDTPWFSMDRSKLLIIERQALEVWHVYTGSLLYKVQLSELHNKVEAAEVSPDGARIIARFQHGRAKIWDASTQSLLRDFNELEDRFWSASLSSDGSRLLTLMNDPRDTIKIWDMCNVKQVSTIMLEDVYFLFGNFSPDGSQIVTISSDFISREIGWKDVIRIWDAHNNALVSTIRSNGSFCYAEFSLDGSEILTTEPSSIRIWDTKTGRLLHTIIERLYHLKRAMYSPDGSRIITEGSYPKENKVFINGRQFFSALIDREKNIADKRALIKKYAQYKVDFNTLCDTNGNTMLHVLVYYFYPQEDLGMIAYFISHYPELLTVKNNAGETPMQLAAMAGAPMLDIFTRAASIRAKKDIRNERSSYQRYWKYLKDAVMLGSD